MSVPENLLSNKHFNARVGKKLRTIRKNMGLTQKKFAQKYGYSPRSICYYEKGGRPLPSNFAIQIRREFGIDLLALEQPPGSTKIKHLTKDPKPVWRIQAEHIARCNRGLRNTWKIYEKSVFSPADKKRKSILYTVFLGAVFYSNIRFLAIDFDIPFGTPIGEKDWVLATSILITIILLPIQIVTFRNFMRWTPNTST